MDSSDKIAQALRLARSTGGKLELDRAKEARRRAPGQVAPSKYMPGVPRQVRADGGKIPEKEAKKNLTAWHKDADMSVKNPDGSPKVFYHRTSKSFDTFNVNKEGNSGPALFFGDNPEILPQMHNRKSEGDHIMPVHLNMRSPLLLDEFNLKEMRDRFANGSNEFPHYIHPRVADNLKSLGYDGIVAEDIYGRPSDGNEYIVFHPHQVKSAIGNSGQFDPEDPNITKAEGGEVENDDKIAQALRIAKLQRYSDPKNEKIGGWNWRPLSDVVEELGDLREIPSHVQNFGHFMDETAKRARDQGLSARDLIKAYTITLSSIQRGALSTDKIRAKGMPVPNAGPMLRPEGAFGEWLHTPAGQTYLDAAQKGQVREDTLDDMAHKFGHYGFANQQKEGMRWAAQNLPGKEGHVSHLVAAAMQGASPVSEWRDLAKNLRGIDTSKAGFVASLMGRGDQPTFDARQRILHTGMTSKAAGNMISGEKMNPKAQGALDRLISRQKAMNLSLPPDLAPYYQHLAHHAVWDQSAGEETTHQDVMDSMRHAASGGRIDGGHIAKHPVAQIMRAIGLPGLDEPEHEAGGFARGGTPKKDKAAEPETAVDPNAPATPKPWDAWKNTNYQSWDDVPTINPQELVGKRVGSLLADLTRATGNFTGIDSSQLADPEPMLGGPGYPLRPETQKHKLGWAVQGKGKGTAKLNKDFDYIAVHAMNPDSHLSNASLSNSIIKNMLSYVRDKRLTPENIAAINNLVKTPSEDEKLSQLQEFPGFEHPNVMPYMKGLNFESRKRVAQILSQNEAAAQGAPNVDKITRNTLDPNFAGVPYGNALFLLEMPKGSADALVHLQKSGLPLHPSYDWGMHGRIVGKFAHPVAADVLHKTWFDEQNEINKTKVTPKGKPPNLRRSFEYALPVTKITQEIADQLPHAPKDIQSGKAAQLALNAFNDKWHDTDTAVNKGGVGAADFSRALRNSDSSSTLSQYGEEDIKNMRKEGKFTGYKLKDGEVYFGLKKGTNYEDDYGFSHPDLTPNETALVSVVNNEAGAKGIGGAPVVLKALKHGATALDCYAVPSDKHPTGFLPDFYSHFGFEELGRVPFDPKYVTHNPDGTPKPLGQQQFSDMKHEWSKAGWDEKRHPMPSLSIMKWRGNDADRSDAVRRYVTQSAEGYRSGSDRQYVGRATGAVQQGAGQGAGAPSGQRGVGNGSGNLGPVGANNAPRPADRFTRTLTAAAGLSPVEARHYGVNEQDVAQARKSLYPDEQFASGGYAKARNVTKKFGSDAVQIAVNIARQHKRGRP